MTKHRRITGFVAIALMAVVATISATRSHSPTTDGIVASAGTQETEKFLDAFAPLLHAAGGDLRLRIAERGTGE